MHKFRNVLAVGAHPDDVEYSCLGFLASLRQSGTDVFVYVASSGSQFDTTAGIHREEESKQAFAPFGFDIRFSDVLGMGYYSLEKEIRELVLLEQFDCVVIHDPNDTHQEHRLMYEIMTSALRRTNTAVLRYRSVSSTLSFQPNLFVDISPYYAHKIDAIRKHVSQNHKPYMQASTLEAFHTFYHPGEAPTRFFEQYFIERLYA